MRQVDDMLVERGGLHLPRKASVAASGAFVCVLATAQPDRNIANANTTRASTMIAWAGIVG